MRALVLRECRRVTRLWTQTILAPVVSSALFILVFGLSLGSRIKEINGFEYDVFIVPGLIAMAMAQAAFSNNSSSLLQARNDRYINDVLASPMHPWQMNLGYMLGGVFRAFAIGVALVVIALPLTGVPIERPVHLLARRRPARRPLRCARRRRRHLRAELRPPQLHQQHPDPAADVPRWRLLLDRDPALAVAGALARESDLLHGRCDPLRVPRLAATSTSGSRSASRRWSRSRWSPGPSGCSPTGRKLKP